jgi:hypothetical protein
MAEDEYEYDWNDIDQEDWEDIVLRVDDEGQWHVRYEWDDDTGHHILEEQEISWDEFLDIYDEAAALDQELEIEY